uniref:glucan endo-1,3-beta-D-glucosidase n=1 Tax=Globisporangium ultimum (strain ATCC 200006 / CBS 805.95 / DAOM BR144) TaxID=431595 RepID=K3WW36_GLOUD
MPNENSPLLPSKLQDSTAHGRRKQRSVSQYLTRHTLIVVVPLAIVALVGLGWLFAGGSNDDSDDVKHVSTKTASPQYTDQELLALLPPFVARGHPIPPKMIHHGQFPGAIPTNAFWTNLLVGDDHGLNEGGGQITLSPYTVRSLPKRLDVSYGDTRRVVTSGNITEYFNADVSFTGYSQKVSAGGNESSQSLLLGDGNTTSRSIAAFDPLSVTLKYHFENEKPEEADHLFSAYLVRGSPYFTVEYQKIIPVLELNATLVAVNQEPVQNVDGPTGAYKSWTSKRFEVDVQVYGADKGANAPQKWILYFAQERTLQLQFANEKDYRLYNLRGEITTPTNVRLVDMDFYTGPVRVAIVPSDEAIALLDASASVYPVASSVNTSVEGLNGFATLNWETKQFEGTNASDANLLMLANPHHADSFSTQQSDASFKVLTKLGHRTVKSNMTAVLGKSWTLQETLPSIDFDTTQPITKPEYLEAIKVSLANDSNYTPIAQDPYFFGKEVGRQARLALIADTVGNETLRDTLLDSLEEWLTPWLVGSNDNHFVYDDTWGGLCSKNGLKGVFWMTDFGNGWYNDHHFHYGYLLYSVAVVTKFRPAFGEAHKAPIVAIARDIASSSADDKYFPFARHFSWFDGHSFASGVYTLDGGKSQESVSEAINAYYGVYLVGKALKIPEVEHMGHLLMSLEIRAAKTYWQMSSGSDIYEDVYAQNKMTGQIAATKVSYTTWFGPEIEHMHLINMIPFTPITEAFISPAYVQEEYPVLQKEAFDRQVDPIEKRWSGYAYLDLAIINPVKAWSLVSDLDFFDDGNSLTNSLFWIATRPTAGNSTAPAVAAPAN